MATVDELVVKITLDTNDLKKGTKETKKGLESTGKTASKQAGDISSSGKKAAGFYKEMRNEVLGLYAAYKAVSGAINLTLDRIDSKGNLSRLSSNLGESITDLNAWGKAVEVLGGHHEDFESTISGMSQALQEMQRTGDPGKFVALQQFGVMLDFWDKSGVPKKGTELLLQLSDAFKKMADEGRQAQAFNLGKSLGIDEGTINLMMRGSNGVNDLINAQIRQSALNNENAKSLEQAQEAKNKFIKSTENLVDSIIIRELPAIQSAANWFNELGNSVDANTGYLGFFLSVIESIVKELGLLKTIGDEFIGNDLLNDATFGMFSDANKKTAGSGSTKNVVDKYGDLIKKYADQYGVDPNMIAAMIQAESGGNPNAVSPVGAKGLMQFMPDTAKNFGLTNPFDPEQSIRAGSEKMAGLLTRYKGDKDKAILAYHAGEGNLETKGAGPASKAYLSNITSLMGSSSFSTVTGEKKSEGKGKATKEILNNVKGFFANAAHPIEVAADKARNSMANSRILKEHDAIRVKNLADYLAANQSSTSITVGDININNPQTNDPNKLGDMVSDRLKWNMTNQFESGTR